MIARHVSADDSPALRPSPATLARTGCGCWASHPDAAPAPGDAACGWCGTWVPPRALSALPASPAMLAPTLATLRLSTRIALRAARALARLSGGDA